MKKYPYKIVCTNCGTSDSMSRDDLDLSRMKCPTCHSVGACNYVKSKERSKAMAKTEWKRNDRVVVNFGELPCCGSILKSTKTKAKVLFDGGDIYDVKLKDLRPETNCGTSDSMSRDDLDLSRMKCPTCDSAGACNYVKLKERSKAMAKIKWKQDDRVVVNFGDEPRCGSILKLTKTKAKVLFDDEEVYDIKLKDLRPETDDKDKLPTRSQMGFQTYDIQWDKNKTNFKFKAEGALFYGWWRKVTTKDAKICFGVDLMVEHQGHKYNVHTLQYYDKDPRDDLRSLNADICAAANKWFYQKCQGTFDTIEDLQQRSAKPTIKVKRLQTLDNIILKLKEYRDTALRSGGMRVMMFTGDEPDTDPSMRIEMDLTTQAMGLKERVPSLTEGVMLDEVAADNSKKKKGRGKKLELSPDNKNVQELLERLKSTTDKVEQRKLRRVLRKMGHKGGIRK